MGIKDSVRKNYAQAITGIEKGSQCCSCCGPVRLPDGYSAEDALGIAVGASFGCGNPTALAALYAGETVLDLGCGAGLDLILSARRVGHTGMVFGLDMTDEMLAVAGRNIDQSGLKNIKLLKGDIEHMPLPDNAVDVIISNCVINLSPDKARVLREAFRVLKPGGRFAVFDIVLEQPLPQKLQGDSALWSACISGALLKEEYLRLLGEAGFEGASIEVQNYSCGDQELSKLGTLAAGIKSGFIRAKKPSRPFLAQDGTGLRPAVPDDLPRISTLLKENGLPLDGVKEH